MAKFTIFGKAQPAKSIAAPPPKLVPPKRPGNNAGMPFGKGAKSGKGGMKPC